MPKGTGLKKRDADPHSRQLPEDDYNRDEITRLQENPYMIKRHVIQHQQSFLVPNMYYYQPFYFNPALMHPNDVLQRLTVENVKRVVREKQLDMLPLLQMIHNTFTSVVEYAPVQDNRYERNYNRQSKEQKFRNAEEDSDGDDEIILSGIEILKGPTEQALSVAVTPDVKRQQKNLNITITQTPNYNNNNAHPKNETKVPEPEVEYEYEDEEDATGFDEGDEVTLSPPPAANKLPQRQQEPQEDERWNLGTFGWDFSAKRNNTGDGIFVSQIKVRRGGVAIAGPGGIATAGSGGTAVVGPGGFAYTHPGSVAIAGSGSQVVAVDPQITLQDAVAQDVMNNMNKRNRTGLFPNRVRPGNGRPTHRPRPRVGKVVAVGPVIYYNRG